MHVYSINNKKREMVIIVLVALDIFINFVVAYSKIEQCLLNYMSVSSQNGVYILLKTVLSTVIPVGIYGGLYYLYNRKIWKFEICKRIHKIPDLNGEWQGTVKSVLKADEVSVHTSIHQTWNKIKVTTIGNSRAVSESAAIEINEPDEIFFRYAFKVDRLGERQYLGYNCLRLNGNVLEGEYFTAKELPSEPGKGSKGFFRIEKIS